MNLPNPFIYHTDTVAGLDFSLNCPALCVVEPCDTNTVCVPFDRCHFYYLTNRRSHIVNQGNIHGELHGEYDGECMRYGSIADWVLSKLKKHNVRMVGIEGYAYSAKGNSITKLAEACGLVKWFLHTHAIPYDLYPPSEIKKFVTSKGNADKDEMYSSWLLDTEIDLNSVFGRPSESKIKSPCHDIVDSYYIAMRQRLENVSCNGDVSIVLERGESDG